MSIIGRNIGNYQVQAELSPGNLGPVWLARHVDNGTRVAIRQIPLAAYSASTRAQLKSRIRRATYNHMQLSHPGLVRVLDLLPFDEGLCLVNEYVAGHNLRDLLGRKGLPTPPQVIYLCRQALKALDYMHTLKYPDESEMRRVGIVHQDLKPSNMILENSGRLRLTDYGLVSLPTSWSFGRVGFEPGTIEYMAPERLRGAKADPRADIYSLGVTTYELLTGQHPFQRRDGRLPGEGISLSFEVAPPPLHEVRKDVSTALSDVLMKALSRQAVERYWSAADFLQAIEDLGEEGQAREEGAGSFAT